MASEHEKTVFGVPGLPLDVTDAAPEEKEESPGEKTMVGLSFGADEMAQLESAIASVEQRETGASEPAAPKPSSPRAAPLPPPRPRGSTTAAPAIVPPTVPEAPANGTVLMTAADFGDLDALLGGSATSESEAASPEGSTQASVAAGGNATMLFDAEDMGDALSGVFGQITSGLHASEVSAELNVNEEPDEIDAAFAATGVGSSDARTAALAALEEEQRTAAAKADVRASLAAAKAEPPPVSKSDSSPAANVEPAPVAPPATAAGTLLMSAEMIEQAAAAAVAAAKPVAAKAEAPSPPPSAAAPASNATVMMAADSGTPDSSSTRKAYAAADLADGKTEIPAPEKTKRYQTGATPRLDTRPPAPEPARREAPLRAAKSSDGGDRQPVRRDNAALWVAGIATVLVLAAIAWFLLRR